MPLLAWFARGVLAELAWRLVPTILFGVISLFVVLGWSLSIMAQPAGIYWLAAQAPPEVQAQHPLLPISAPTTAFNTTLPNTPLTTVGPVPGGALPAPPADQWAMMQQAANGT